MRGDLQSYARLLLLLSHFELGNYDILDHLAQSCYRFMQKKKNLTLVQEMLFRFFKNPFKNVNRNMQPNFEKLLNTVLELKKSRYETRTFAYIDIISWLESKVKKVSMREILEARYAKSKHKMKG
jgi:hypothetical protein